MLKYVIKRLLLAIFILVGVSIILYALVRIMPPEFMDKKYSEFITNGDTAEQAQAKIDLLLARYNLGDNSFGGVVGGWWKWITAFFAGDLGMTFKGQEVGQVIFDNMGVSFAISLISLVLELIIAIPLGIKCACNQYGKLDYTVTVFTMIGISFPSFFFASILIKIFSVDLGWFPIGGFSADPGTYPSGFAWFGDTIWHLILPIVVLTILSIGSMMRYTRTNTLEVLNADYIRTARAKGLSERKVVYKHVFRNTLIPLVTTLAGVLPSLFGGAMVVEQVFAIDGIGNIAYQMTQDGDIFFIMGYDMFIAVLTVIGILLTDIMYAVVDPRVKLGK